MRKSTSKPPARQKPPTTMAIHVQTKDGSEHLVGIAYLRVMLVEDDGSWFAQGLEIDYFAQGSSIEDTQRRFQDGLKETIDYHLKLYGTIEGVLRVAPQEVWDEFYGSHSGGQRKLYNHVSVHFDSEKLTEFPFDSIAFIGVSQRAA